MQSAKTPHSHDDNNNNNNNQLAAQEPTVPFSAAIEPLLNQFSYFQATQANSFRQLTASLLNNDNDNNYTNTTSPAGNGPITANLATMGTLPLSPASECCSSDLLQDGSASSSTRSMRLVITEVTSPPTSQTATDVSADDSSSYSAMHHPDNDRQHLMNHITDTDTDKDKTTDTKEDKCMDMDMDMDIDMGITPLTSNPTIVKEPTPTWAPFPTDSVMNVGPMSTAPSFQSGSEDAVSSSNNVAIQQEPTPTDLTTPAQPTSRSAGSLSSSSSPSLLSPPSCLGSSASQKLKDPTPSSSVSISLPPSSTSSHIPAQLKLLSVKYNADNNLTLSDFVKQLLEVFDYNPTVFRTDTDRIKYALRSMGAHTSRYFEPLLNKSVPDRGKCLTSFTAFLKKLEDRFGEPPSVDMVISATAQLLTLQQAGITMCDYIMTFREYAVVVRWEDSLLMHMFHKGISPEVRALLGNANDFQSLSMLQVAAVKAYSVQRTQTQSATFEHQHQHSTFNDQDLEQAQELLRVQNWRIRHVVEESARLLTKIPPLTSFTATPTTTATETESTPPTATAATAIAISAIAKGKTVAKGKGRAKGNVNITGMTVTGQPAGTYFKSHAKRKLTEEEKQYRADNDLCWYCGGEGHASYNCPLKKLQDKKNAEY
jgi:hypothetical protein